MLRKQNNIVSEYGWSFETIICLGLQRSHLCFLFSVYAVGAEHKWTPGVSVPVCPMDLPQLECDMSHQVTGRELTKRDRKSALSHKKAVSFKSCK